MGRWKRFIAFMIIGYCFLISSCKQAGGNTEITVDGGGNAAQTDRNADVGAGGISEEISEEASAVLTESAGDGFIDFEALRAENEDIFGWIYLPGTRIDDPLLQSAEADDYYEARNALKGQDESGALYTELANLTNMCDFNTVVHGKSSGVFADLYKFADPDFFHAHEKVYVYLDGNLLAYEIFAAFERENTSLIRTYDFTYMSGCSAFLEEVYRKGMGKQIREGWEGVTPYHFLLTLTTREAPASDKQFVVVAALVEDAAGTIDRVVE